MLLSAIAMLVAFVLMAFAIQDNLFQSRVHQTNEEVRRTISSVQRMVDSADVSGSPAKMTDLFQNVRRSVDQLAATPMTRLFRAPGSAPNALGWPEWDTGGFNNSIELTTALRTQVSEKPDTPWWQSAGIRTADGRVLPGVVWGQVITVPDAGKYELYFAYDLTPQQDTLNFVQGVLWIAGIVLLAIIGVISWLVLRVVTGPIADTAVTSAQLAAGRLGVRVRVQGEDELATLGHSFNAMADSIERQIAELGELSLVQQRFVSDVSHELRTPLTTIRLASVMINDRREEFDPATARAAELLEEQVARFEELLTDLLEISRYDAGSVQLELDPTSLAQLAEDVVAQMAPLAEQHGSDIRVVAPGGYSPVDMDPRRVRRIVRNLVGNAIEHGEGKPIVVSVDSDQQAVAIGVRDFGVGMRHEDTERVFDRFWRADPSRKRTIGGTGLGLSIALGDAKLHHGTLAVWSEPGRGTNFVLTLPRDPSAAIVGDSPVPLDPGDDATAPFDALGITEPIVLPLDDGSTR